MPVVAYGHYLEAIDPTGLENIILEGFTDNNKAKILPKYQGGGRGGRYGIFQKNEYFH